MAGLNKVPAIIKDATEEEAGMIALVENIQRENLGYIEEAKAYRTPHGKIWDKARLLYRNVLKKISQLYPTK